MLFFNIKDTIFLLMNPGLDHLDIETVFETIIKRMLLTSWYISEKTEDLLIMQETPDVLFRQKNKLMDKNECI